MSKILFYDLETTGLFKKGSDAHRIAAFDGLDQIQNCEMPEIVQIAWCIYEGGKVIKEANHILKIQAEEIHHMAVKTHGITKEITEEKGIEPKVAFKEFLTDLNGCDELGGYNIDWYDTPVLKAQLFVHGYKARQEMLNIKSNDVFVTVKNADPYSKWPKLIDACGKYDVDVEDVDWHDALGDIRATVRLFQALESKKKVIIEKSEYDRLLAIEKEYKLLLAK